MNKSTTETLVTCPTCGIENFTPRGLSAHRCKGKTLSAAPGGSSDQPAQAHPAPGGPLAPAATKDAPGNSLTLPNDRAGLEAYMDHLGKVELGFECGLTFTRMMQGACLAELRKLHGREKGGRPETSEEFGGFVSWAAYVQSRFGFSDDTARARIAMWEAGRPRLKKMADQARAGLSAIFERPISSLNAEEMQVVHDVTHKLTDGKTVRMIQEELGLFKGDAPKPSGGHHPKKGPGLTLEEQDKLNRLEAQTIYQCLHRSLWSAEHKHGSAIAMLPDFSQTFPEEMDLLHMEQAALAFLRHVQTEMVRRGSQPTKYRL